MGGAEEKLCEKCTKMIQVGSYTRHTLHRNYHEFIASKKSWCIICSWLWALHQPPDPIKQGIEDVDDNCVFGKFGISFRVPNPDDDLIHHPPLNIHLSIESSWAGVSRISFHIGSLEKLDNIRISSCALLSELEAHPWSTLGPNIGSDESLGKIHQWISSCQANHTSCGSIHGYHGSPGLETGTFFPTRVVDVEKADVGIISIRDRAEVAVQFGAENEARLPTSTEPGTVHKYPVYWTLSHRWGNTDEMPRLLKDTELRLRKGVRLDELPPINKTWPAFRDAALLVKRLGYRYIWIDSLCIFQDSASEWQREASTMIDIYRHSHCNISAGSASYNPAKNGLFRRRKLHERLLYPAVVNLNAQPCWIWHIPHWNDQVERVPLNRRGWVVQERFLTTRTIHFAESQIFWECLEGTDCESKPTSKSLANLEKKIRSDTARGSTAVLDFYKIKEITTELYPLPHDEERLKRSDTASGSRTLLDFFKIKEITTDLYPLPHDEERLKKIYRSWVRIVEYYASCELTKESDRLIAVSGMAKAFQEATGDTYMAGLWKGDLDHCLTWQVNIQRRDQVRRSEYAPSWSWVSISGSSVKFYTYPEVHHTSYFKLIEERIVPEPPNGDSFGLLRSAELDVECMLCYLRLQKETKFEQERWEYYDKAQSWRFFERDSNVMIQYDSKNLEEFYQADRKVFTVIPVWGDISAWGRRKWMYCLILKCDVGKRFKRVGLMKWYHWKEDRTFDRWAGPKRLITLI